jgi:hypothetical protein
MDRLSCLLFVLVSVAIQSDAASLRHKSRDLNTVNTHNDAAAAMVKETASEMDQLDKLRKDYAMLLDKMITKRADANKHPFGWGLRRYQYDTIREEHPFSFTAEDAASIRKRHPFSFSRSLKDHPFSFNARKDHRLRINNFGDEENEEDEEEHPFGFNFTGEKFGDNNMRPVQHPFGFAARSKKRSEEVESDEMPSRISSAAFHGRRKDVATRRDDEKEDEEQGEEKKVTDWLDEKIFRGNN